MDRRNQPRRSSYRPARVEPSSRSSASQSNLSTNTYRTNHTRHSTGFGPTHKSRHDEDIPADSRAGSPRVRLECEEGQRGHAIAQCIIGTCPFMCPEKERSQREHVRDLALFERVDGNPRRTSSSLAVKKFCRTISTKEVQASDLRPLPVLEHTLNYLMNLLDLPDHPFEVVHDFIFDRTRSIRQDLSMQNIANDRVIWMYEKMVRFHVISNHKLRRCKGDHTTISSIHHLNMEQLTKCLASLYNLYQVNRNSDSIYDDEAEFRSLYVLLHLDSHTNSVGESLSLWFSRLPSSIIRLKEMCFARRVLRFFRMGNYWRFFCSVTSEATYLQMCVIEPYIYEVRVQALACINCSGYKLHPYPLAHLSKIVRLKESDLESFCNACGLTISLDDMGNKVLPTKQTGFFHPKGGFQCMDFAFLEALEK